MNGGDLSSSRNGHRWRKTNLHKLTLGRRRRPNDLWTAAGEGRKNEEDVGRVEVMRECVMH